MVLKVWKLWYTLGMNVYYIKVRVCFNEYMLHREIRFVYMFNSFLMHVYFVITNFIMSEAPVPTRWHFQMVNNG
jgi:hypothetical protein